MLRWSKICVNELIFCLISLYSLHKMDQVWVAVLFISLNQSEPSDPLKHCSLLSLLDSVLLPKLFNLIFCIKYFVYYTSVCRIKLLVHSTTTSLDQILIGFLHIGFGFMHFWLLFVFVVVVQTFFGFGFMHFYFLFACFNFSDFFWICLMHFVLAVLRHV